MFKYCLHIHHFLIDQRRFLCNLCFPKSSKNSIWTHIFSPFFSVHRSLSSPSHLISPFCVADGYHPFRETFVGGFFGLSSSAAAAKYFRRLQFPSREEPRYMRLWAVGLNADRRAPSWITPHQTLQSLTIYWAKHRWEGSPLLHTHTHNALVYTQTCCTNAHAQENKIWDAEMHLYTHSRAQASTHTIRSHALHTHTQMSSLLNMHHVFEKEIKCKREIFIRLISLFLCESIACIRGSVCICVCTSQWCHHRDEVISDIYPANHVQAHHYHTSLSPFLSLLSSHLCLSLGCVRSQRSLSVLTC